MGFRFSLIAVLLGTFVLQGCSVLIGNVRHSEEPAEMRDSAGGAPLLNPPWFPIEAPKKEASLAGSAPELSFQNRDTGSTIAFTTGCRKSYQKAPPELKRIAKSLGNGLARVQSRHQEETAVAGIPAIRSTVVGTASRSEVTIHDLIFSRDGCVFDLTLVSLTRHVDADLPAFEKILAALPFSK